MTSTSYDVYNYYWVRGYPASAGFYATNTACQNLVGGGGNLASIHNQVWIPRCGVD